MQQLKNPYIIISALCVLLTCIIKQLRLNTNALLQGFFDEDSMDEFIASETEESSMSLTSEDEKIKK